MKPQWPAEGEQRGTAKEEREGTRGAGQSSCLPNNNRQGWCSSGSGQALVRSTVMDRRINDNNGLRRERRTLFRPARLPHPHPHPTAHPPAARPTHIHQALWRFGRTDPLLADSRLAARRLGHHRPAARCARPIACGRVLRLPRPSLPCSLPYSHSGRVAILSGTSVLIMMPSRRVKSRRVASQPPAYQPGRPGQAKVGIGIQNLFLRS